VIKKAIGGLTQATMGTEPVKSIRSPVTRVPPAMSQVAQTDQIINRMGGQLKRLVGRRVTAMAEGGKVGAIKKAVSRVSKEPRVPRSLEIARQKIDSDYEMGYINEKEMEDQLAEIEAEHNPSLKKAEGGKVGAVKRAINSGLSKLSIGELSKRLTALETQDAFYDETKNADLKKQWQAIYDEAARRGITLIDDQ